MFSSRLRQQNNQNGQVFLEFILMLVLLMSISMGFMVGFRHLIATRWEVMVQIIAAPNGKDVHLP
jgi:hypothetical protein